MNDPLDPRPQDLKQRVWESIQRDELPPQDDRGRMRVVMNNLVLHLHPSKVAKPTLKFTYTWGLGGLALLLAIATSDHRRDADVRVYAIARNRLSGHAQTAN